MSWIMYKTVFCVKSPIHIGWDKFSILHKTRPYITGRNLWGALTAKLAACRGDSDYKGVGENVDEQLRFSYFYPSTCKNEVSLFPWCDSEKFYWLYINGYGSSALKMRLAEDASLHEIEYISPKTREGDAVYMIGYIFEREGNELKWRDVLGEACLGGERGYGWGNVELLPDSPQQEKDKFFELDIELDGADPQIKLRSDDKILAHAIAVCESECKGILEPFIGRETKSKDGFGTSLSKPEICWMPGSSVKNESRYAIVSRGLWKRII